MRWLRREVSDTVGGDYMSCGEISGPQDIVYVSW